MRFYDIGESPLMGHSEKHIAPLLLGGIIAAGASLAGNAIGASSQNKTNQTSIDINRENNAFNAEQAQIQRNWQEKMWGMNNSYNSPNAMISRGLNPFVQGWFCCSSYHDWKTDRKSTRLNSSHRSLSRMPSSA